jgi:hypothetical protein
MLNLNGMGGTRTLGIMMPDPEIQCCNFNYLPRAPVATQHDEAQLRTTDSRKFPAPRSQPPTLRLPN